MISINNKDLSKLKFSDVQKFLNDFDVEEDFFIEFKSDMIVNKDLVKEICAFSNTFGGYIFLGVEDDKSITGCTSWTEERINTVIRDSISPIPVFDIKKVTKNNNIKIYVIKVEEGMMPPYVTNKGVIYERISSGSFPVSNIASINMMIDKRKDNLHKIENKLYIDPIHGDINNLCGYLDFGFSLLTKDIDVISKKISNANFEKISEILRKYDDLYSISKVGYSICVTLGDVKLGSTNQHINTPAGLSNFFEILPDGSFRSRIILASSSDNNIVPINSIFSIEDIFREIYFVIFGDIIEENFVEARCYEKLVTLKTFEPRIIANLDDPAYHELIKYHELQRKKYGSNIVANSNRVPMNGFYVINRYEMENRKIKYNASNLLRQLFMTSYYTLGYIDRFEFYSADDKN